MKIEVLLSTMNHKNENEILDLLKKMNLKDDIIVINQCPNEKELLVNKHDKSFNLISKNERGLSKSRNAALKNSTADICVIADDDLVYEDNYKNVIEGAYEKYPDADIIGFYVESKNKERKTSNQREGRISYLDSMKLASFQLTFKRKSINDCGIQFDYDFGAGTTKFVAGEENIFLFDCLKKGLKIYYLPVKIAVVSHEDSTWFKGFDERYFITKGAAFYRMSNTLYHLLIFQFALRKYSLYCKQTSLAKALKYLYLGKKEYKEMRK